MIAPAKTRITTPFGWVKGYPLNHNSYPGFGNAPGPDFGFHTGVDFGHSPDKTIYMPEDGIVKVIPWDGKTYDGNAITTSIGARRHFMGHMSKFLVANNQEVKEGTPIGIMGETGYADGVHLHWTLRVNGVLVDGMTFVEDNSDMPTANEVKNFFKSYLGKEATAQDVAFYTVRPWAEMAGNICDNMLGRIQPRPKEIVDFFKTYLNKVATEKDVNYYTVRPWQALFNDIATTLKNQSGGTITREQVMEYINKNLK